tara:strand:+ start:92 stop:358 length:267 start_codon:yes stop_codon:yes gene_type:complete
MRVNIRTTKPLMVSDIPKETKPIRSREDIQLMLDDAIERRDAWLRYWDKTKLSRKDNVEALRNYTALRGVVKSLKWVLMHTEIEHPLD